MQPLRKKEYMSGSAKDFKNVGLNKAMLDNLKSFGLAP